LRFDPAQQGPSFFGIAGNVADTRWRRQGGCRGRINDLEKVNTKQMKQERSDDEDHKRSSAWPGRSPVEQQGGFARSIHFGGAVANATAVMPCSSARFVTRTTMSYDVVRSALIMMARFSRLAASSSGANCS